MMRTFKPLKGSACAFVLGASLVLAGCGGGGDDDGEASAGPVPSFAGSYDLKMTRTLDNCNLGLVRNISLVQSVSQNGRAIVLVSNDVTLTGSVDPDNAGLSASIRQTSEGIPVVSSMVYRSTATPGVYNAGFSVVATKNGQECSASYSGTAKLRG